MLEVVGTPMSIRDNILEQNACDVSQEIGVGISDFHIHVCHYLKDNDQTIVKFTSRKDCPQILRAKRQMKGLHSSAVDLPEGTIIFFCQWSLRPYYRRIWNNCKKLMDKQKVHQYYTLIGLIRSDIC